ncbi:MAG: hypothetical protein LBB81_11505 [Treponema sp.]|nr:hypothetical protein [Treponema sp.]
MERIKDLTVVNIIEKLSDHYRTNISNRFLRPILLQLQIDKNTWDQVEELTEKMELSRYHGFHLDDLYHQIAACAHLVQAARHGMVPNLRNRLGPGPSGADKVLREMAANNFASNLQVFADMLHELFLILINLDKEASRGNPPVYTQIPELSSIDRELSGR